MPEWELLKIKELADLLQLNQQTVRNMVNRGELEYLKLGRTKYIPRAAAVKLADGTGLEIARAAHRRAGRRNAEVAPSDDLELDRCRHLPRRTDRREALSDQA